MSELVLHILMGWAIVKTLDGLWAIFKKLGRTALQWLSERMPILVSRRRFNELVDRERALIILVAQAEGLRSSTEEQPDKGANNASA